MGNNLKPLNKFNSERLDRYGSRDRYQLNGIACPQCGSELVDVDSNMMLMSYPPKIKIKCLNCSYKGTRIA